MKKNNIFIYVLVIAASVVLSTGVLFAADFPDKLAITYVKAPLNVPSIVAKDLKIFEKSFPGVAMSFPEITQGPKQSEALASGEIGVANCIGATSAILAASEGLDLKIFAVYSRAPKAFMIVVKDPAIKSVKDLKGKKIGGPKGTILHQLLAAALAKEGMSIKDVEHISMSIPAAGSALENGSVDAALMAGPAAYTSMASGARMLKNGEGLIDATTVIATTDKYMKAYPKVISKFMAAHKKTIAWIKKNPGKAKLITQKETALPKIGVNVMYPWYDFDPTIRKSDIEELERTQTFMLENGLQRNKIDISTILLKLK